VTLKSGALVPRSPAQIHDTVTCITTACIALSRHCELVPLQNLT
jgi:hypothetical protein